MGQIQVAKGSRDQREEQHQPIEEVAAAFLYLSSTDGDQPRQDDDQEIERLPLELEALEQLLAERAIFRQGDAQQLGRGVWGGVSGGPSVTGVRPCNRAAGCAGGSSQPL